MVETKCSIHIEFEISLKIKEIIERVEILE